MEYYELRLSRRLGGPWVYVYLAVQMAVRTVNVKPRPGFPRKSIICQEPPNVVEEAERQGFVAGLEDGIGHCLARSERG